MSPTKESTIVEAKKPNVANKANPALGDVIAAELERTDLGHLINEYKNLVIVLLALFIFGAFGFAGWKSWKNSNHEKTRQAIVEFRKQSLAPALEKKKPTAELFAAYQSLFSRPSSPATMMELTPEIMIIARDNSFEKQDWVSIFKFAQNKCSSSEFCFVHFALAGASLLEDYERYSESLQIYQSLIGNSFMIEDKLYFDLARLAKKAEQEEQKKTYVEFLKKNHSTSNYKTLAEQL